MFATWRGLGVMGRRVDASVPQDQPDLLERNAMAQHLGRRRVSQDVRPLDWRHDAGPLHEAFHHRRDAVTFLERSERRDIAQEHVIARAGRRAAREVGGDRIPDVLRKRQTHLVARLARDPQRARLPLDVVEAELRHVARGAPRAGGSRDHAGAQRLRHRMPRSAGSPAPPPDIAASRLRLPSRDPGNGILRAETGGRIQAQNA